MNDSLRRFLGADELRHRLAESGRPATVVAPEALPWLPRPWFGDVISQVAVEGAPYSVVCLMARGHVGLRQGFASGFTFGVGPVPLHSTTVMPLQYHFVVRGAGKAPKTKLRSEIRGVFRRERVRLRWEGSLLALQLMNDQAMMRKLEQLSVDDGITLEVDPRHDLCRVVLQRYVTVKLSVFEQQLVRVHREAISNDLLDAIDTIATHARQASTELARVSA
jgi:hypothetical protein